MKETKANYTYVEMVKEKFHWKGTFGKMVEELIP